MNLLQNKQISISNSGQWSIEKSIYNGTVCLSKEDNFLIHDHSTYIYPYCDSILNLNPSSVLILGLGLSLLPNYYVTYSDVVDVIEKDIDLINLITGNSFNETSINIINDDAFTYTTDKTYDLIISDIHWFIDGNYTNEISLLRDKYNLNLNDGGKIFFYLTKELFDKY